MRKKDASLLATFITSIRNHQRPIDVIDLTEMTATLLGPPSQNRGKEQIKATRIEVKNCLVKSTTFW